MTEKQKADKAEKEIRVPLEACRQPSIRHGSAEITGIRTEAMNSENSQLSANPFT